MNIEDYNYSAGFGDITDTEQILAAIGTPETTTFVVNPDTTQAQIDAMTGNVPQKSGFLPDTIFGIDTGVLLGYAAGAILLYLIITASKPRKKRKRYKLS